MIKPLFLSYRREDQPLADAVETALSEVGIPIWRDVNDIPQGGPTNRTIRRAIRRETSGFVWLATPGSLESETICLLEIPTAMRRHRKQWSSYPFIPLFNELSPSSRGIDKALGSRRTKRKLPQQVRDANGIVREKYESQKHFAERAGAKFMAQHVRNVATRSGQICIQARTSQPPNFKNDLSMDWSSLLPDGWPADSSQLERVHAVIKSLRSAAQDVQPNPQISISADLRLPISAFVGWELNPHRYQDVAFSQERNGVVLRVAPETRSERPTVDVVRKQLGGQGPVVLAVSAINSLSDDAVRYASSVDGRSLILIHTQSPLNAATTVGLAEHIVQELNSANASGTEKHLLMRGPSTLAFWIGRLSSGTGHTVLPYWDGAAGYKGFLTIGDRSGTFPDSAPMA